jgi:hypothetical protein
VSPDYPAKTNNRQVEKRPVAIQAKFGSAATNEVTRRVARAVDFDEFEDETAGAELEIATLYRRKLAGLRHMPRSERPLARRAMREWYRLALRAIREKRAVERHARRTLRQLFKLELR